MELLLKPRNDDDGKATIWPSSSERAAQQHDDPKSSSCTIITHTNSNQRDNDSNTALRLLLFFHDDAIFFILFSRVLFFFYCCFSGWFWENEREKHNFTFYLQYWGSCPTKYVFTFQSLTVPVRPLSQPKPQIARWGIKTHHSSTVFSIIFWNLYIANNTTRRVYYRYVVARCQSCWWRG